MAGSSTNGRWLQNTKTEAVRKRKDGHSYTEITKSLGVSKSTLHYWLKDIDRPVGIIERSKENWLTNIQLLGALANKKKRVERLKLLKTNVEKEVLEIDTPVSSKKIILSMLYWAEGAKGRNEMVNFANTDPQMILLFVTLLRESFCLDESKFRVRLHLHYYHTESDVRRYWSKLLCIPETQFTKSYRKKRGTNKTFRRNEFGICFLKYNSMALKEEILFLAHLIADRFISRSNEAKK